MVPRVVVVAACALSACARLGYDTRASDGGGPDAMPGPDAMLPDAASVDAGPCPPECNAGCAGGTCHMLDPSAAMVTCPPGMACEITCAAFNACGGTMDCADATSCTITCTGERSCDEIHCGSGPCQIDCPALRTCDAFFCENAPSCTVVCGGDDSCGFYSDCGTGDCDVQCNGIRSCAAGVRCSMACACDATCPPDGCPAGMWTHECPPGCDLPTTECTSATAGCDVCP